MKIINRAGPLFTDLYELTMAAGYYEHRIASKATFSLFIRDYPPNRIFFLPQVLKMSCTNWSLFTFPKVIPTT